MAINGVLSGGSARPDAWGAVGELHAQIGRHDAALILIFCSPSYDRRTLADAIRHYFGDAPVYGCTTAGEITPFGYISNGLCGISFDAGEFQASVTLFDNLRAINIPETVSRTRAQMAALELADHHWLTRDSDAARYFGLVLIDGLSVREEQLMSAIGNTLTGIPLIGGSAADGLKFNKCFVYCDGVFISDAAILILVRTKRRFSVFKTEHFVPSDHKMIVTGADLERRRVYEINGEPAALEYARLTGHAGQSLSPRTFAAHPVVVRVGGEYHVRAIQRVNPDNSLTFFCAIDEGLVLTLAESVDILDDLAQLFTRLRTEIGAPDLIIGCDCVLRNLELEERALKQAVSELFVAHRVVGFCTYGEQYMSMHVNQTLTGIAIGAM